MRVLSKLLLCLALIVGLAGITAVPAEAATTRKLTASYSTKTPLTKGVVTVSGKITKSPKGTVVTIQRKVGKKWKATKSTKTTTSAGAYSVRVAMSSKRGGYIYRASVSKKGSLKAAVTGATKISVRSLQRVTVTAPTTIGVGSAASLSITVSPFKSKAKVAVQRLSGASWVTIATPALSSKGKVTYAPKPTVNTTYRVVSPTQSSSYLAAGTSSARTVAVVPLPIITTTTLPGGEIPLQPYSTQLATSAGRPGTWSVSSGALPPGLSLSTAGLISGTPTTLGTSNFTIKFKDTQLPTLTKSENVSIVISAYSAPSVTSGPLPGGRVGVAYVGSVTTTVSKPGTWSVTGLPSGLSLNSSTGAITGSPLTASNTSPSFTFTETAAPHGSDTKSRSINILAALPVILTTTLPSATVGKAYPATLATVGNKTGAWTITSGALPTGLNLTAGSGAFTGAPGPGTAGSYPLTVTFTETSTSQVSLPKNLTLTVGAATAPIISTTSLPGGTAGSAYNGSLAVTGSPAGTWAVTSGVLPSGLTLAGSGAISGTAGAAGTFTPTFTFTQASTGLSASKALSIVIAPVVPTITTSSLPDGALGTAYSQQLTKTGLAGTWSKTENLPSGLMLNSSTGVISGTPGPTSTGTASFTVKFTQTSGGLSVSTALNITVKSFILTTALPAGTANSAYSAQLHINGNAPGTWILTPGTPGSLPGSLVLDPDGLIHGTAPNAANYGFIYISFLPTNPSYPREDAEMFELRIEPTMAGTASTTVSAGSSDACRVDQDHELWCWGYNFKGQLGIGPVVFPNVNFSSPVQVGGANWRSVSSGGFYHSCAIKTDNTLYCMGYNTSGQLGTGNLSWQDTPTQVAGTNWATVSAGTDHTCATTTTHELWCWGAGGKLGTPVPDSTNVSPVRVGTSTDWASVTASYSGQSCALKTTGTLWCWGSNYAGEVGNGAVSANVGTPQQVGDTWSAVSAGSSHTCGIKQAGTLWCWGENTDGELGNGTNNDSSTPVQVGSATDWKTVAAGGGNFSKFSCATKTNGTAWCWGGNFDGQLGNGSYDDSTTPVQLDTTTSWESISTGITAACGVKKDDSQRCWGRGANGELGNGQMALHSPVPVIVN